MYTAQVQLVIEFVTTAPHPVTVTFERTMVLPTDGLYVIDAEGNGPL